MLNNNRILLNGILFFCIITISIAYFIQYFLGHKPCNLCLIERIPYLLSLILIPLMFIIDKFKSIISILVLTLFIMGSIVSFYHLGIEQGFFNESFVCNLGGIKENLSKEELLKSLQNSPISCKDVTFRFLGLSLATINTITSLLLSIIMVKVLTNLQKQKKN